MSVQTSVRDDIDRGLEIVGLLKKLGEELKEIDGRLKAYTIANPEKHVPLIEAEREGRRLLAEGTDLTVPIIITADVLMGSFRVGSEEHKRVIDALTEKQIGHFDKFFKPVNTFENRFDDGHKFRKQASQVLGEVSVDFVAACRSLDKHGLPKHSVKIEWQQAAAAAKLKEVAS